MKLIFDHKKANPKTIDTNTWFYVPRSGRSITIIHQTDQHQYIHIKIQAKILEETLKR